MFASRGLAVCSDEVVMRERGGLINSVGDEGNPDCQAVNLDRKPTLLCRSILVACVKLSFGGLV